MLRWIGWSLLAAYLSMAPMRLSASGFCRSDPVPRDPHHEFQFFAGYSPDSSTLIGTTLDRRFVAAGFDYSYRCWAWERVSISFTPGVMPAAILLQPAQYIYYPNIVVQTTPPHAVYGFAVTPVGFTVDLGRTHPVFPFFQMDGGVIASTERIPENVPDATALNFLFDFSGGVKWRPNRGHALTLGYKFLHISNAYTTPVNPGVDNNLIYVGYSWLR